MNDSSPHNDTPSTEATPRFQRSMQMRHVVMLSLGGVIGTGLFMSSGATVHQAGPLGAILAYVIGGFVAYLVMMSLGELAVHMPETGAFSAYATRYIGPATGYTVAWLYWLTWTIALGAELTASGMLMRNWFPDIPIWYWSALFGVTITLLNVFTTRLFAESEFWLSLLKVLTVIVFLGIGIAAIIGLIHTDSQTIRPGLHHLTENGIFPNGLMPVLSSLLVVTFAFSGTELIGIAAGETADPSRTVPKAIRMTLWRLIIFFVGAVFVIATLLPYKDAGLTDSPFVTVFKNIGIPYTEDIMRAVILTAMLSAANSGLYASSRMLWTISEHHMLPRAFGWTSRKGIPVVAVLFSMLGGLPALLSEYYPASTLYLVLTSLSAFAVVAVWMSISASHIMFRRALAREGKSSYSLDYRVSGYPFVPALAFLACLAAFIGIGFDSEQRPALYYGLGFTALCYFSYGIMRLYRRGQTRHTAH